jgi:hypothetical protein
MTKHLASTSTASSGSIRYPVIGKYPTNVVSTWNINTNGPRSDFSVKSLSVQTCANPNPCVCDALLLYEVNGAGVLEEITRICGDTTNQLIQEIQSQFILAFFTDSLTQSENATGINAEYFPAGLVTSSTTERTTSTTTERPGSKFIPLNSSSICVSISSTLLPSKYLESCGQVIQSASGTLRYKLGETYGPNERCVFTIRHTDAISYHFRLISTGINDTNDGLSLSSLRRDTGGPLVDHRIV